YGTGDLFVHLHIYTPTNVSKEEREILERLRDSENFDPYKAQKDKGFFSRMRDIFSS
ncbi:MAG: molecular chaperone DnaJ, partial [Bacteroidota bacterium]